MFSKFTKGSFATCGEFPKPDEFIAVQHNKVMNGKIYIAKIKKSNKLTLKKNV